MWNMGNIYPSFSIVPTKRTMRLQERMVKGWIKKQKCCECGEEYVVGGDQGNVGKASKFLPINNFLFGNGYLPICNYCIEKRIRQVYEENDDNYWNFLDTKKSLKPLCFFL